MNKISKSPTQSSSSLKLRLGCKGTLTITNGCEYTYSIIYSKSANGTRHIFIGGTSSDGLNNVFCFPVSGKPRVHPLWRGVSLEVIPKKPTLPFFSSTIVVSLKSDPVVEMVPLTDSILVSQVDVFSSTLRAGSDTV